MQARSRRERGEVRGGHVAPVLGVRLRPRPLPAGEAERPVRRECLSRRRPALTGSPPPVDRNLAMAASPGPCPAWVAVGTCRAALRPLPPRGSSRKATGRWLIRSAPSYARVPDVRDPGELAATAPRCARRRARASPRVSSQTGHTGTRLPRGARPRQADPRTAPEEVEQRREQRAGRREEGAPRRGRASETGEREEREQVEVAQRRTGRRRSASPSEEDRRRSRATRATTRATGRRSGSG